MIVQFKNAIEYFGKVILNELNQANIKTWVAGGAVRDYFMGVPIKTDYDLFFPNQMEYEKCKTYFQEKNSQIIWENENTIKITYQNKIFDLIKKHFQSPQETIQNFDFTVSMFAVDNEKVYYGESSFIDLSKRQLMLNKIPYPASTLKRAFKYYNKGFKMCSGEMKKLVKAIQAMPQKENIDENVDKEPLSGGDVVDFFIGID